VKIRTKTTGQLLADPPGYSGKRRLAVGMSSRVCYSVLGPAQGVLRAAYRVPVVLPVPTPQQYYKGA